MYIEESEVETIDDWQDDDDNPFIGYGEGYIDELEKEAFGEEE